MTAADPESVSWLRIVMASVTVLGLLAALSYGLKYVGSRGLTFARMNAAQRRLGIVETLTLDPRRRLVIVRRDDREHLLLLGINQDIVVEANLPPASRAPDPS